MSNNLVTVEYASASMPSFQHVVTSRFDFDATIERLITETGRTGSLGHHEINPQILLERGGCNIGLAR